MKVFKDAPIEGLFEKNESEAFKGLIGWQIHMEVVTSWLSPGIFFRGKPTVMLIFLLFWTKI